MQAIPVVLVCCVAAPFGGLVLLLLLGGVETRLSDPERYRPAAYASGSGASSDEGASQHPMAAESGMTSTDTSAGEKRASTGEATATNLKVG